VQGRTVASPGMQEGPARDGAAAEARYAFSYGPDTPYAHAMHLVEKWRVHDGEVLVDLGCGFGAIAEPAGELGLTYLGLDVQAAGVESLRARGAEAVVCDLSTTHALFDSLTQTLRGRRVAAFTMLDAAEHLANAAEVLAALSELSRSSGDAPLVVSIPNVSHRDLAAKLLLGRWDVTPTGLLDETHVRFFAPSTLERQMRETGWEELGAQDFQLEVSDQHFPADAVALLPSTPVGAFVRRIRGEAAPGATTNQFVRAYRPVPAIVGGPVDTDVEGAPFLSVVVWGRGPGDVLRPTFAALDAQDEGDFEVITTGPGASGALEETSAGLRARVRAAGGDGGGGELAIDRAVAVARGRYLAVLRDGDVPRTGWVGMLAEGAARNPGRVLRVDAGDARAHAPNSLFELVTEGPGALAAYALPRSVSSDMGLRFISATEGIAVWHALVRAVELCGLAPLAQVGMERTAGMGAGLDLPDAETRAALHAALDREPLVLDRGAAAMLAALHDRVAELDRAVVDAERRFAALESSTSWRMTAPLRALVDRYRRR
jgi:2-polyprenyl-3-methyl-5-hydroxy-6-metoxy-1,4-benzoquinol methylase